MSLTIQRGVDVYKDKYSVMWDMRNPPHDARLIDDDSQVFELEDKHWNVIVINNKGGNKTLAIPIQRHHAHHKIITLPTKDISLKELFEILYHAYHKVKIELHKIEAMENDAFDYVKNAIAKIRNGEDVYFIDIMGDKRHYEGFEYDHEDCIISLCLGS